MRNAIWAIYNHCIEDDSASLEEQHAYCPKDGWCRYWTDKDNYNTCLPPVFRDVLKPIFDDLSKDSLLNRCLLGLTQNQNESINGVLWKFCPKITFVGRSKLELGVYQTIGKFNSGASFVSDLLTACGVESGTNTNKSLTYVPRFFTYSIS